MEPNPLDAIISANSDPKPTEPETATAVAEPPTATVDDPEETKAMPAILAPVCSEAAEEVARKELEKSEQAAAAAQEAKDKADAEAGLKQADEAHQKVLDDIKKEAAAKEAARWAQIGTPDSTFTAPSSSTKVNVLKVGLTRAVAAYATDPYDAAWQAVKEVVIDDLQEAVRSTTNRDLEIHVPRVELADSYARYAVELHENRSGDDTRQLIWCFVDIPLVTGWPIKISSARVRSRFEPITIPDREQLEAFFGLEWKRRIEDSEVMKTILQFHIKKEIK